MTDNGRTARLRRLASSASDRVMPRRFKNPMGDEPREEPADTALPVRQHQELSDLPAETARQLEFTSAAPKALRESSRLPPEVVGVFQDIWDQTIADVYDELGNGAKRDHFDREVIGRVLKRIAGRLEQGQTALIVAGTVYPSPGGPARQTITAGASGAALAGIEEVVAYTSSGAAAATAVLAAVVAELLDTYLAASARTRQYRTWGRDPSPELIAQELAAARGVDPDNNKSHVAIQPVLAALGRDLVRRTSGRFVRVLVPVVGIGIGAYSSAADLRRITRLEASDVTPEEADRLRRNADKSFDESLTTLLDDYYGTERLLGLS